MQKVNTQNMCHVFSDKLQMIAAVKNNMKHKREKTTPPQR